VTTLSARRTALALLLAVAPAALATACTEPGLQEVDTATEARAIAAASRAFSDAYVRGDTATIGDLYTENAVLLPPGGRVEGREAIKAYFAPSPDRQNLSHAMTSSELTVRSDIAVDVGTWSNSWRMGEGDAQEASETYLVVWEKGTDGQWRIRYDMWHRP
jgi:uncharacterized protein (TIGR02246 family)